MPTIPRPKTDGTCNEWDDITPDLIHEWAYDTEALLKAFNRGGAGSALESHLPPPPSLERSGYQTL